MSEGRERPLRILQLASTSNMGGAEHMMLWLGQTLGPRRFTVSYAALVGGEGLIERAREAGFTARHFHFRMPFDPVGMARLAAYMRELRVDIVQTHGLRADMTGRWLARLSGARAVVSTIHSVDPWRRWHHSALDRATAPFVSRYIAVCQAGKDAVVAREKISPDRIDVIHIGLPPREIPFGQRDEIRAALGLAPDAFPVVGMLANTWPLKGHADVIDALPALAAKFPNAAFLFAGRDESGGRLQALAAERGVAGSVHFLGFRRDTDRLLAAMDIFLMASHWEGLPVSILEALHAGVPIVATEVGGIPEIVRHGNEGLLIPPKDPAAIAAALLRLSGDESLRAAMSAAAKLRAREAFTVELMTSRTAQVYEQALRRGRPGKR